jgi:hypothetical protein
MWQLRLKSVVSKLSMLGIYLLFLSVQLNLKYTFSDLTYSTYCQSIANNTSEHGNTEKINATKKGKHAVQKLRLNKRYVPEDAFHVSTAIEEEVARFLEVPEQIVSQVYRILTSDLITYFLRGPPLPTLSLI